MLRICHYGRAPTPCFYVVRRQCAVASWTLAHRQCHRPAAAGTLQNQQICSAVGTAWPVVHHNSKALPAQPFLCRALFLFLRPSAIRLCARLRQVRYRFESAGLLAVLVAACDFRARHMFARDYVISSLGRLCCCFLPLLCFCACVPTISACSSGHGRLRILSRFQPGPLLRCAPQSRRYWL